MSFEKAKSSNAIDYMLRTTQQQHVQLGFMVDQKANIIIAFSSVLLTISFANCTSEHIWWGFVTLGLISLAALIIAVLSVVPKFERKKNSRVSIEFNPLFFGHFTELSMDEYFKTMQANGNHCSDARSDLM
jgi:hypothetical protein